MLRGTFTSPLSRKMAYSSSSARSGECIIVPRQVLEGLLTALHIQLSHPSCHQLKAVSKRYLYAPDMDKAIDRVTQACRHCTALCQTPKVRMEQSSCPPPNAVGVSFTADVIKHSRALVLVLQECVTSFPATTLLEDEHHHSTQRSYPPLYPNASARRTDSRHTYWPRPRIKGTQRWSIPETPQNHHRDRQCKES